jgi:Kef-type K+ transport system membrane component KefB/nucleotide-binding universal stress UspA family protein
MQHTHVLAIFLGQVILLLAVGRLLGELMERIGQPPVMGQLLAGLLLGHSVLGALLPEVHGVIFPKDVAQKAMLQGLSEIGVLFLLLLTGMETNLDAVRAMRRTAVSVSLSGIVIPFACGVAVGMYMPETLLPHPESRLATALFLGTALSISSVKVVAAVVRDMGFLKRRVGRVMISAAIVDDTLAWIVIAVTASLAMHGEVNFASVGVTLLSVGVFLAFSFTIGRRIVVSTIRWANDRLSMEMAVITAIIVMTAAFALTTELIGVHTVLGAFVAGLLVGRSPILTRQVDAQLRGLIIAFFMPIFFGAAGLSADLTVLLDPRMALFAAGLVAIASIGKFAGAYTGGLIGGLNLRESTALAWGMNARGSTEIIVASIGLSIGALSQDLFTMIVAMAVLTTLMMPPALRWSLRRVPVLPHEKEMEAREKEEEGQFLPRIERILAVVDRSASGQLAARLVGHLAGSTRKLTAVMDMEQLRAGAPAQEENRVVQVAVEAAQAAVEVTPDPAEQAEPLALDPEAVQDAKPEAKPATTESAPVEAAPTPKKNTSISDAVATELRKGYDLVVFGADRMPAENTELLEVLSHIEESYQGARAFVVARERRRARSDTLRILLPVTGADYSRRGAEVAVAIAAAAEMSLCVLAVSRTAARESWYRRRREPAAEDRATMDAIRRLAERRGVQIFANFEANEHPDVAITRFARRNSSTLIVLGVKERLGPAPSFGPTADAVLQNAPCSVLLLST